MFGISEWVVVPFGSSLGVRVKCSGLQLQSWRQEPFSPESEYFKVTQPNTSTHSMTVLSSTESHKGVQWDASSGGKGDSALSFRHRQTNVDGFRSGNPKAISSQLLTKGKRLCCLPQTIQRHKHPTAEWSLTRHSQIRKCRIQSARHDPDGFWLLTLYNGVTIKKECLALPSSGLETEARR